MFSSSNLHVLTNLVGVTAMSEFLKGKKVRRTRDLARARRIAVCLFGEARVE